MRKSIKRIMPKSTEAFVQSIKVHIASRRNANRSVREVFREIYLKGLWGSGNFCSGSGSVMKSITQPYIDMMIEFLQSCGSNKSVVDLGCGDFQIGKHFIDHCSKYIGVDVVPELIERNNAANWGENVGFLCVDIIEEDLPDGEICFLRQVLQHLSNDQICRILTKLHKYDVIFITEHHPADNPNIIPNKDKVHGASIRAFYNSGVYLDKAPFSVPPVCMQMVLEVRGSPFRLGRDPGVIRTFRIEYGKDTR